VCVFVYLYVVLFHISIYTCCSPFISFTTSYIIMGASTSSKWELADSDSLKYAKIVRVKGREGKKYRIIRVRQATFEEMDAELADEPPRRRRRRRQKWRAGPPRVHSSEQNDDDSDSDAVPSLIPAGDNGPDDALNAHVDQYLDQVNGGGGGGVKRSFARSFPGADPSALEDGPDAGLNAHVDSYLARVNGDDGNQVVAHSSKRARVDEQVSI
jgi:hypothetical protein